MNYDKISSMNAGFESEKHDERIAETKPNKLICMFCKTFLNNKLRMKLRKDCYFLNCFSEKMGEFIEQHPVSDRTA